MFTICRIPVGKDLSKEGDGGVALILDNECGGEDGVTVVWDEDCPGHLENMSNVNTTKILCD